MSKKVRPDVRLNSAKKREKWINEMTVSMKQQGFKRFEFRGGAEPEMTATKRPSRKRKMV